MKSKQILAVVGATAVLIAALILIFLMWPGEVAHSQDQGQMGTTAVNLGPVGTGFTY